jgi:hypothetical protein
MLTSCLYPVIWVERPNSQFGMVGRVKKLESDLSEDGYYRLFRRFKKCPDTTSEEDVFQLIHLAAKNSLNDAFFEIAERIPASRLLHLFSVKSYQEYSMDPAVTSLDFAVDLGNYEMIRIAFERISTESQASETEFLQKIYESFLRFSENYIKSRSTWDKKTKYEVGHVKLMNMLRNIFSEEKYQSLRKDLVSAVCYYEEQPHCDVPHDDPFHDQKPNVRETIFSEIVRNLSSQELVELMSQRSSCGGFSEKSILDVAILQGKHQVISEILEKVKNDSSCLSQVQDLISKETTFLKSRKENR